MRSTVTPSDRESTVDFRDVFRRIGRRAPLLIAVTVATTMVALAAGLLMPKEYTATATLTVSPISLDPLASSSASQQININTEREVLRSTEVARIASESLDDGVLPETLNANSSVAAPSQSQVLQVSVSAEDPTRAADYANAMAQAYLTFRAQGAALLAQGRIAEIDERIATAEAAGDNAALLDLRSQRAELEQVSQNPGRIIGVAQAPDSASSLGLSVFVVGGLFGGLLAGAVLALIRDATDRRVRSARRMTEILGREGIAIGGNWDAEAYRWIMRAIRAPFAGTRRTRPIVVAVLGVTPAAAGTVVEGLKWLAEETGTGVAVIDSAKLPAEALDRPYKYTPPKGGGIGLVLIDASHVWSGARIATLADGCDVAVVVASRRSSISGVRSVFASIGRSALENVVPVFTTTTSAIKRTAPSPARERAAASAPRIAAEKEAPRRPIPARAEVVTANGAAE